jgi:osmotically-inducible protein OsmY
MSAFPGVPDDWYDPGPLGKPHERAADPAEALSGAPADEMIADQIATAVRRNSGVRGNYLEIQVQNRVVILLGEVVSADARTVIRRLAWEVPGVWDVCNRVRVVPVDQ